MNLSITIITESDESVDKKLANLNVRSTEITGLESAENSSTSRISSNGSYVAKYAYPTTDD